jgi:lipopolysaccharide transport system permease protein
MSSPAESAGFPVRTIAPASGSVPHALSEWVRYRVALAHFARTFVRKRYGGTWLGIIWIPLRPALGLTTGALVYGGILGVRTGAIPYFLWLCTASASWTLFSETSYFSTRSLEIARKDLRKIYIPRLVPLTASATMGVTNLVLYLVIGAGAAVYYLIERGTTYLALRPASVVALVGWLLLVLLGLTVGLWLSHFAPIARDVRWTLRYVLGLWYLLTPVIYPVTKIPPSWRILVELNPATGPIELVKYGLLDAGHVTVAALAATAVMLVVFGSGGLWFFVRRERADVERI